MLRSLRELTDRIDPILGMTELRTTAPDDLWLSGSYRRDTLAIAFTWLRRAAEVASLLPDIEAAVRPSGAGTHWGKVHWFIADDVRETVPKADDARDLFDGFDPRAVFANAHLQRLELR